MQQTFKIVHSVYEPQDSMYYDGSNYDYSRVQLWSSHRLSIDIIVCEFFNATSALVVKLAIHPPSKSRPGDSFGRFKSRNSA